jgi:hypothetical protein
MVRCHNERERKDEMKELFSCEQCGEPYWVGADGVSHHYDEMDPYETDWDKDADHTPYGREAYAEVTA